MKIRESIIDRMVLNQRKTMEIKSEDRKNYMENLK